MATLDEIYATMPEAPAGLPSPDGLSRHKLTVRDVWRMVDAGVLAEDDRVELWEGQLVAMSSKLDRHEWVKNALISVLNVRLYRRFTIAVESSLFLSDHTFVEPDIAVIDRGRRTTSVRGPEIHLAIEVGDSTFRTDLNAKAPLYALHGAPLLWVVDARETGGLVTHVHRQSKDGAWVEVEPCGPDIPLTLPFAPDVSFTLNEVLFEADDVAPAS